MRTIIPGSVSPAYLRALRDTEVEFFKSITMSDLEANRIREEYPIDGSCPKKHPRATEPGKVQT